MPPALFRVKERIHAHFRIGDLAVEFLCGLRCALLVLKVHGHARDDGDERGAVDQLVELSERILRLLVGEDVILEIEA